MQHPSLDFQTAGGEFTHDWPKIAPQRPYTPHVSSEIRKVNLADRQPLPTVPRYIGVASWLVAPILLAAVIGGLILLRKEPAGVFAVILGIVCGAPVVWGLISMLFPAYPDRRCPECKELGLESMSDQELHGVRCSECGFTDETLSTWKFAEERGQTLEPLVIAKRGKSSPVYSHEDPIS
ncbi:MAG: DNA-directed RNA polymerase subunit RPC12/RpoP [Candidatus Paceibacteria bacterium]|jgi:DNA-directed RNA polymerase subunit RPC12/RpoP